jgi:eukaryotic-like serine/threonine-protein kinase
MERIRIRSINKKLKKLVKPLVITAVILILLFFLLNNYLMPLYVQKGETTKVPDIIGMSHEEARKKILDAGLEPKLGEYKNDKQYEVGIVIGQNPLPNTEVKFGRGVYLTISGGEEYVEVPNLRGKSIREAVFNLEQSGLVLGTITYEPSMEIFANTIIRQEIAPNTKVRGGNLINVTVSQGQPSDKHAVPDITSKSLSEAEKILLVGGFRIGIITHQYNVDLLPNTVVEQSPKAGELVQLGQFIDVVVTQKNK